MEARFHLRLSAEKYREYYAGNIKAVQVVDFNGRTIRFPVNVLQPFLTHEGVEGEFVIRFDENHHFVSINKTS